MLLMCAIIVWALISAPNWLVVDEQAHKTDIVVVLGGGGGSRFRAGLALYDSGKVSQLLLVDRNKQDWLHIQNALCPQCNTNGKDVIILEGSTNTYTDASIVAQYAHSHNINSMLVVTDPYHTRRAQLVFESQLKGSNISVTVLSSGDYVGKLPPDSKWWRDNATAKLIWGEISRIVIFYLRRLEEMVEI